MIRTAIAALLLVVLTAAPAWCIPARAKVSAALSPAAVKAVPAANTVKLAAAALS